MRAPGRGQAPPLQVSIQLRQLMAEGKGLEVGRARLSQAKMICLCDRREIRGFDF